MQLVNTVINAIEGKVNKVINAIEEKYSVKFNYVLHCNIFFWIKQFKCRLIKKFIHLINILYFKCNKYIILNNVVKFNYILQLVNTVINAIEGKIHAAINAIEEKYSVKFNNIVKFNYILHCNDYFIQSNNLNAYRLTKKVTHLINILYFERKKCCWINTLYLIILLNLIIYYN